MSPSEPGAKRSFRQRLIDWSSHRNAPSILGVVSFAESSFFPIPPDIMLIPMCVARPDRAIWFATLTTATSVIGGLLGYVIGAFFFDLISPLIENWGYTNAFATAKQWFDDWGFWTIVLAGLIPVPYKVCTITAGMLSMPILPFVVASIIGRGKRFYLLAWLIKKGSDWVVRKKVKSLES